AQLLSLGCDGKRGHGRIGTGSGATETPRLGRYGRRRNADGIGGAGDRGGEKAKQPRNHRHRQRALRRNGDATDPHQRGCRSCGYRAHVRLPPDRDRKADARTRRRGGHVAHGRRPGARRRQGLLRARPAGVAVVGRSVAQVAVSPGLTRGAGGLKSQVRKKAAASAHSRLQALVRGDSILPTRRDLLRRGMIMAITVYPVTPSFAAEIGDVDLAAPIDPTDLHGIKDAFTQYAVLIFPDQHLSQDQHLDFARYFGPLETTIAVYRKDAALRLRKEFADVSNLNHENEVWGKESRLRSFQLGTRLWPTDRWLRGVPGRASLLYPRWTPPVGGHTEFADERAAYDALPEKTKRRLDRLVAEHSIFNSRARLGFTNFSDEE